MPVAPGEQITPPPSAELGSDEDLAELLRPDLPEVTAAPPVQPTRTGAPPVSVRPTGDVPPTIPPRVAAPPTVQRPASPRLSPTSPVAAPLVDATRAALEQYAPDPSRRIELPPESSLHADDPGADRVSFTLTQSNATIEVAGTKFPGCSRLSVDYAPAQQFFCGSDLGLVVEITDAFGSSNWRRTEVKSDQPPTETTTYLYTRM